MEGVAVISSIVLCVEVIVSRQQRAWGLFMATSGLFLVSTSTSLLPAASEYTQYGSILYLLPATGDSLYVLNNAMYQNNFLFITAFNYKLTNMFN